MDPLEWIREVGYDAIPPTARTAAVDCLLDTLGIAAAATRTRLAETVARFVSAQMPGTTPLLFTAGTASNIGAALHGAALIDALDGHDGHVLTKGHVGAVAVPALFALPRLEGLTAEALLAELAVGYEVGTRAGIALHNSASDYHSSGAWNALGVAAMAGRRLNLSASVLREALGIAEYYGPRSQMLRCIDHPTMVKDGSAWGAMTGISAALLAADGFTGAPALTVEDGHVTEIWADLGRRWRIAEQYRKPYPVCRWAQPAIEAVRELRAHYHLAPKTIERIDVITFHEARRLAVPLPETSEQAQYSLPWAVACAIHSGDVLAGDVVEPALAEASRRQVATRVVIDEKAAFNAVFPAERWATVHVHFTDGTAVESPPCQARGDYERPLSREAIASKFFRLTMPVLGTGKAEELHHSITTLERHQSVAALCRGVLGQVEASAGVAH